jgi:hypothetical protein
LDVLEHLLLGVEKGLAFLGKRYLHRLWHLVLLLVGVAIGLGGGYTAGPRG